MNIKNEDGHFPSLETNPNLMKYYGIQVRRKVRSKEKQIQKQEIHSNAVREED